MGAVAAVVIPVYKEHIDENEKKSLQQCLKVLGAHPIIFAFPESLNTAYYSGACKDKGIQDFSFISFDSSYFESVSGYNKLLLSADFYSKFVAYDYMLLYQLDAYVFKDELLNWCAKGFSYIGAPWFVGQDKSTAGSGFMEFAGNGGFSLRKISDFLKVLRAFKIVKPPAAVLEDYEELGAISLVLHLLVIGLKILGFRNNSKYERKKYALNEDFYWAFNAHEVVPNFKAAKAEDAIAFAFECQPKRMYELNQRQLPFGCHAWLKYDYEFWKPYLA